MRLPVLKLIALNPIFVSCIKTNNGMKVFKFGGASVKDDGGIRNLFSIVRDRQEKLIIVVSAMGKTTNLLETLCNAYFHGDSSVEAVMEELKRFHLDIVNRLFPGDDPVHERLEELFASLRAILHGESSLCYDYEYDRVICYGELLSTTIVSGYLALSGIPNRLVDIRKCLKTDQNYRAANIDPELSGLLCRETFDFATTRIFVTQGFIAGTRTNQTTTLGREGSDYTAALLANLLDADDVTIWKDVPGVMNADPKEYDKARVIRKMSYKEAIELSHFGAKVIHPKTIKPVQNKQIPLYVKSFLHPSSDGTVIEEVDEQLELPPIYINKGNQCLLTLTPRDFSFIAEEKLSHIFAILARYKLKLNLMQNSAISFSFCVDCNAAVFNDFLQQLQEEFEVRYNQDVKLITIRHYTDEAIREIIGNRPSLVEQRSRTTAQFVLRNSSI